MYIHSHQGATHLVTLNDLHPISAHRVLALTAQPRVPTVVEYRMETTPKTSLNFQQSYPHKGIHSLNQTLTGGPDEHREGGIPTGDRPAICRQFTIPTHCAPWRGLVIEAFYAPSPIVRVSADGLPSYTCTVLCTPWAYICIISSIPYLLCIIHIM